MIIDLCKPTISHDVPKPGRKSNSGWTSGDGFYTMASMVTDTTLKQIAHLTADFNETVRDPLWRDIPLSKGFKSLFTSRPMQKLNRIKQLGPAYLVYPGAVHTRLDHSLGVFHATRLIILSLLNQIRQGTIAPVISEEGIRALLTSAMLHDMGHFPYAHALKDMVSEEHEALGALIIENDNELRDIIENQIGTSVETVCKIIDTSRPSDDREIGFLRTILSGTLDPDKLDYLSRDALFCGIPYGIQDASYIIRHLSIVKEGLPIGMPIEAIGSVEHLLFAKYSMYRNVYWHHGTRGATAMIKKAVQLALAEDLMTEKELYGQDDESFASLFLPYHDTASGELFNAVRDNRLLVQQAAIPFQNTMFHQKLYGDKQSRENLEMAIFNDLRKHYRSLKPHEIIIDIPEDVSFESDIPILREDGSVLPFSQVDELFTKDVVKTFTASLRKIQLYTPGGIEKSLAHQIFIGLFTHYEA